MQGLWSGIQSLAGWIWDKVSGWISGIWDGICSFFGINSPSKEMAWVNEAANAGIVDGYPDGTFGPQKLITRAEAMTMVNRTIDRHPHEDHLLDDMIVWPDNPETAWYYEQVQEATNSHEYTMNTDDEQNPYEIWTELLPVRDWAQLEKEWSDAHSGQSGGDVV